jgi:hypothetical protein
MSAIIDLKLSVGRFKFPVPEHLTALTLPRRSLCFKQIEKHILFHGLDAKVLVEQRQDLGAAVGVFTGHAVS